MTQFNIIQSLNEIIEETVTYQSLIDSEAWDELDQKLKDRQLKLESILKNPIVEAEKSNVISILSKVANLDKNYQHQLKENRKQSTSNVLVFRRKHKAASAYQQNQNN